MISGRWLTAGQIEWLRLSPVDTATHNAFMKAFEVLGEAIPQLALALTYYWNNQDTLWRTETSVLGLPTTLVSVILSFGSVIFGMVTGLRALLQVWSSRYRTTPLHRAAVVGSLEEVRRFLLSCPQSLDVMSKAGKTALMVAADRGHLEVVTALLRAGAQLELQDESGWTALIWAARHRQGRVLKALIASGARTDVRDNEGQTALTLISSRGYTEIAAILTDAGADINLQDNRGNTALIYSSSRGHWRVVKLLLSIDGVDVHALNKNLETALHCSVYHGHVQVVESLIASGGKESIDAQNTAGETALMQAARFGEEELVKVLMAAGARLDLKNKSGVTALDVASTVGKEWLFGVQDQ